LYVALRRSAGCLAFALTLLTLAGCGAGAGRATFTGPDLHFSIAYDPAAYDTAHRTPAKDQEAVRFTLKKAIAGPGYGRDYVTVTAAVAGADLVRGMLSAWGKGSPGWSDSIVSDSSEWQMLTRGADAASWTTFNGLRGVRTVKRKGGQTTVGYLLAHGQDVYFVELGAPTASWAKVSGRLNELAQSFRVSD